MSIPFSELPLLQKIAAVAMSALAIGTVAFVFGFGRIWFRRPSAKKKEAL